MHRIGAERDATRADTRISKKNQRDDQSSSNRKVGELRIYSLILHAIYTSAADLVLNMIICVDLTLASTRSMNRDIMILRKFATCHRRLHLMLLARSEHVAELLSVVRIV